MGTESAVVVPVPGVEAVVGDYRLRLDPSAGWGVPAHVTVVYPFVPPPVGVDVLDRLRVALASVPPFECVFSRVEWFLDDEVMWLAPEPDRPFRVLTDAVWRAFPGFPPYGGRFADVVPHLTVGANGDMAAMRSAAAELAPRLPVTVFVDRVLLLAGRAAPGGWHSVVEFRSVPAGDRIALPHAV